MGGVGKGMPATSTATTANDNDNDKDEWLVHRGGAGNAMGGGERSPRFCADLTTSAFVVPETDDDHNGGR